MTAPERDVPVRRMPQRREGLPRSVEATEPDDQGLRPADLMGDEDGTEDTVVPVSTTRDAIGEMDSLFGDSSVPNTQPPTEESRKAVLAEAVERREKIEQGARDNATADRMFSGKNAGLSTEARVKRLKDRNNRYAELMALNCAKPLAQGVDGESLINSLTAAAVLWTLSPQFRSVMGGYRDQVHDKLRSWRSHQQKVTASVPLGSSPEKIEEARTRALNEDKELRRNVTAVLSEGEDVAFSPDSAAATLVQLNQDAYVALREGEPEEQVLTQHEELVTAMEQVWTEQGLNMGEVRHRAWELIGELASRDEAVLAQYGELAYGTVRMGPQQRVVGADGKVSMSWNHRWTTAAQQGYLPEYGVRLSYPRPTEDAAEHLGRVREMIEADLDVASEKGPEEIDKVMVGYQAAWDLRDVRVGTLDVGGHSRHRSVAAVERMRIAHTAMVDDGMDFGIREALLGSGVEDSYSAFAQRNPEAAKAYAQYLEKNPDRDARVKAFVEKWTDAGTVQKIKPLVYNPNNPEQDERLAANGIEKAAPEPARESQNAAPVLDADGKWCPRPANAEVGTTAEPQADQGEQPSTTEPARETKGDPQRKPVTAKTAGVGPTRERKEPGTQAAPIWTLLNDRQRIERKARGYPDTHRVPHGFPAIPASSRDLARELAERERAEEVEKQLWSREGSTTQAGKEGSPVKGAGTGQRKRRVQNPTIAQMATAERTAEHQSGEIVIDPKGHKGHDSPEAGPEL